MKKKRKNDFLRDDKGRIKDCTANTSKMSVFQYGYYFGWSEFQYALKENIKELPAALGTLLGFFLIVLFPWFLFPLIWYLQIRRDKQEVKRWERTKKRMGCLTQKETKVKNNI